MQKDVSQENKIVLLYDDPVDQSAFKWHERIADALEGLISTEVRGRIIGLFGSWGSGKSTVIEMLAKRLSSRSGKNDENYELFIFDAWAHSHDPLRRSFFEELRNFYVEKRYTTEKEWEEDSNKLSRRQENSTVKTTPMVQTFGVVMLLVYACTAIFGGHFASNFIREFFNDNRSLSYGVSWVYLLYAVVAFLWPLLLIPALQFFSWVHTKCYPDQKEKYEHLANVGSYFFKESQKTVEAKTIKTIDPTTIEFLDVFKRLIKSTQSYSSHKLVIVIDNIDRLPDEEVLTLWATMRSFFTLKKENDKSDWVEKIWVVVPLDPLALERIFLKGKKSADQNEVLASLSGGLSPIVDKQSLNGFIEKTFHATFWITPPVLADNQKYFIEQAQKVFGGKISNGDYRELFHIYETVRPSTYTGGEGQNTPRRIKSFLNQIGIMQHLWEKQKIPLKTLAVYTLVQNSIGQDLVSFFRLSGTGGINTQGLSEQHAIAMGDKDWKKNFAAIFYGVDPEDAVQVMARGDLAQALSNGEIDPGYLKALADTEAFFIVLDHAVTDRCHVWSREYSLLSPVVFCLKSIEDHLGKDSKKIDHLWNRIIGAVKDIDIARKIDSRAPVVIPHLIKKAIDIGDTNLTEVVLSKIMLFSKEEPLQPSPAYIEFVANTIIAVCKMLKSEGVSIPVEAIKLTALQIQATIFWPVLYRCAHESVCDPVFSTIIKNNPALEDDIGIGQEEAMTAPILYEGIRALYRAEYRGKFKVAKKYFVDTIRSQNFDKGIKAAINALGYMSHLWRSKEFDVTPTIKGIVDDFSIYRILYKASQIKDNDAIAACIGFICQHDLAKQAHQFSHDQILAHGYQIRQKIIGAALTDDPLGKSILEVFKQFFSFGQLVTTFAAHKGYILFGKSAFNSFLDSQVTISPSYMIDNFSAYKAFFEEDSSSEERFIQSITKSKLLWLEMEKHAGIDDNFFNLSKRVIARGTDADKKQVIACLRNKLKALKEADWVGVFNEGYDDLRLKALQLLNREKEKQEYGTEFRTALSQSLDTLSDEGGENILAFYKTLPSYLAKHERNILAKHATNDMLRLGKDQNIGTLEKRLAAFGEIHDQIAELQNNGNSFAVHVLIPLIDKKSSVGLKWIKENAKQLKKIFDAVEQDTKDTLNGSLISLSLTSGGDSIDTIKEIMKVWNIKIPPKSQNDSSEGTKAKEK